MLFHLTLHLTHRFMLCNSSLSTTHSLKPAAMGALAKQQIVRTTAVATNLHMGNPWTLGHSSLYLGHHSEEFHQRLSGGHFQAPEGHVEPGRAAVHQWPTQDFPSQSEGIPCNRPTSRHNLLSIGDSLTPSAPWWQDQIERQHHRKQHVELS